MQLKNRRYVIISKWSYPFGGGEEFLYQTMSWAHKLKMKSYWLCFSTPKNTNFEEFTVEKHEYGYIIKVPGGIDDENIYNWLKLLKPDFVHHQGHIRSTFYNQCEKLRVEFLTGFHFWGGGIILDTEKKNIDIIENARYHKTDKELTELWDKPFCNYYTVTKFVADCIKAVSGYSIKGNIYASSSVKKCKMDNFIPHEQKYVSIINIHHLKGGELFLKLLNKMKNVSFLGVKTEYRSEGLDNKIQEAVDSRIENGEAECKLMNRVPDPTLIYRQTKIMLCPSLVDETFCRVINEAMMNGIPVITTGQGNIKYLVGVNYKYMFLAIETDKWAGAINELLTDRRKYDECSRYMLQQYEEFSERKAMSQFLSLSLKTIKKSKEMNVMIYSPWCDQGLGIQSRNYANILKNTDYRVFIFALKPYNADTCIEMQKNPEEWKTDHVYYSANDREHVKDIEVLKFIEKYNIGKCLLPETCWFRVFEVAKLLRNNSVKCYAIPNIEIVKKNEIFKHKYFHKILCNNRLCEDIFNDYGIKNTKYIGYGMNDKNITFKEKVFGNKIKFLFIGGMNAFSRKHILDICASFVESYKTYPNISLTCTIQKTNNLELEDKERINDYLVHPGITFIQTHLSYKGIIDLYYNHHVSIQVSKHEGLGLGFYESLNTGTPVISLDIQPHNEIILDNINGWLVPVYTKPMTDNTDPLYESAYFEHSHLTDKINYILGDFQNVYSKIIASLKDDYDKRIDIKHFKNNLIKSIST